MQKIYKTPYIPVSWGELIDKITILEIKNERIKSKESLLNIKKELKYLNDILNKETKIVEIINELKIELHKVNDQLWITEDNIRLKENKCEFDNLFISTARDVYILNDKRAELKQKINKILKSELVEEKGYVKY